jgi:two-component system nitrogen regulation response regulator NtrX
MPNLSDRVDDIPLLVSDFAEKICNDMNYPVVTFGTEAVVYMQDYKWKGNIRQLKSTVEWITLNHILSEDTSHHPISLKTVQTALSPDSQSRTIVNLSENIVSSNQRKNDLDCDFYDLSLREARENFERQYLSVLMKRFRGNISQMSAHIDMERTALHRKLKTMGIRYEDILYKEKSERALG